MPGLECEREDCYLYINSWFREESNQPRTPRTYRSATRTPTQISRHKYLTDKYISPTNIFLIIAQTNIYPQISCQQIYFNLRKGHKCKIYPCLKTICWRWTSVIFPWVWFDSSYFINKLWSLMMFVKAENSLKYSPYIQYAGVMHNVGCLHHDATNRQTAWNRSMHVNQPNLENCNKE